jgi:hypothetical protein
MEPKIMVAFSGDKYTITLHCGKTYSQTMTRDPDCPSVMRGGKKGSSIIDQAQKDRLQESIDLAALQDAIDSVDRVCGCVFLRFSSEGR